MGNADGGEIFKEFGSHKTSKTAETLLQTYQQLVTEERNKHLCYLQKQFEKQLNKQKKHEATNITPRVDDIVLVCFEDGRRDRLGRITKVNPQGTSLSVLVSGKEKKVSIKNVRILSLYRQT